MTDPLNLYLIDHLTAATGGLRLAERTRDAHDDGRDPELHAQLQALTEEIREDRAELRRIVSLAGATPDPVKVDQQVAQRFKAEPEVVELTEKLKEAKDKLEDVLRARAGPGDPAERAARKRMAELMSAYDQAWQDRLKTYREQIEVDHELRHGASFLPLHGIDKARPAPSSFFVFPNYGRRSEVVDCRSSGPRLASPSVPLCSW